MTVPSGRITLGGGTGEGFAYLDWRLGSGNTVEIFDIAVPNAQRRLGHGRNLVQTLINYHLPPGADFVWAITRAENRVAHEFYRSLRFKMVGALFDFYGMKAADGRQTVDALMYGYRVGDLS